MLRPPATGLAAAVLVALIAGVLAGQLGVWRNTVVDHDAQDFGIFLTSARHDLAGRSLYGPLTSASRPAGPRQPPQPEPAAHDAAGVAAGAAARSRGAGGVAGVGLMLGAWASLASVRALGLADPPAAGAGRHPVSGGVGAVGGLHADGADQLLHDGAGVRGLAGVPARRQHARRAVARPGGGDEAVSAAVRAVLPGASRSARAGGDAGCAGGVRRHWPGGVRGRCLCGVACAAAADQLERALPERVDHGRAATQPRAVELCRHHARAGPGGPGDGVPGAARRRS